MFCTSLRRRNDLDTLVPVLSTSTNPKLRETKLETHDLALPLPSTSDQPRQQYTSPLYHFFLVLSPESTTAQNLPETIKRITRFSTLTTYPSPTIAFLLIGSCPNHGGIASSGLRDYALLQTRICNLPSPPPLIPISSPTILLSLLSTYISRAVSTQSINLHPLPPLALLPHASTTILPDHTTYVLSDLCHSLKEVVTMAEQQAGDLTAWLGEEALGIRDFWAEEWVPD